MLNVIIADDEPIIRNGVSKMFPWAKYDFNIAGVARNGIEALEIIKAGNIDLVISDIKMPKMDGLELLSEAKKISPDICFIIISGYDEFTYVQKALNLQAFGYLLKPLVLTDLEEMVRKITESKCGKICESYEKRSDTAYDVLERERALSRFISEDPGVENGKPGAEDIAIENDKWHGSFCAHSIESPMDSQTLLSVFEEVSNLLDLKIESVIFSDSGKVWNILSDLDEEKVQDCTERFLICWENFIKPKGAMLSVGSIGKGLSGMKNSCTAAGRVVIFQNCFAKPEICDESEIEKMFSQFEDETGLSCEELRLLILAGEREKLVNLSQQICLKAVNDNHARNLLTEAAFIFSDSFWDSTHENDWVAKMQYYREMTMRITGASSKKKALENMSQIIDELIEMINAICMHNIDLVVKRIKAIVKLEYGKEDLSLTSMAKRMGFSTSYLSRVFSVSAKQGFAEYVTKVRIGKAKELLLTDMKISAITEKIGYSSQPYFSTIFRAQTGYTPSEFREKAKKRKHK